MKIILSGITSFRNHGVEALVTTTLDQLRQRLPGSEFLVLDRVPEFDASRVRDKDVRFHYDHTARPLYSSRVRQILVNLSNYVERIDGNYQGTVREIKSGSAVVASGGDVFASEYGHRSLLSHLRPLELARQFGVPYFFHAQSIGPFKTDADRTSFLTVAKGAAAITVREKLSYDYVTGELGLPASLVTHTADPAFLLPLPASQTLEHMRAHYGFESGRPTVALSTSQAICNWTNSNYDQHFVSWCRVIEWLRTALDAHIVLIPHVQEISVKNDDRILATELIRHFRFDPHLRLAGGDYTASEFKGLISQCDLVVAERMHAALAGLSSGVPTVAVGYSIKAEGIISDLLDRRTVKECALMSLPEFLEPKLAIERIQRAWADRGSVSAQLQKALPAARERAARNFDLIAASLRQKS
jgi:colanic acid/amylovoran biosynthesis protein